MKVKQWKPWLVTSVCSLFIGVMNLTEKKYLLGGSFTILAATYICLSIESYKRDKKST